ncbi:MAG: nuoH, partial [Phycisphaerales bacterium]|nr:nuoH [Phycisphaerales bacterium]
MFHWIYTHVPTWAYIAAVSHFAILGTIAYMILLERKVASWTQDRVGPNRVGFDFGILPFKFLKRAFGLGQPLADGLKFFLKEDYKPKGVDTVLFTIAPAIMILVIIMSIAVMPWGGTYQSTRDVEVTGTTTTSGVEAARANLPPNAVVDPVPAKQYGPVAFLVPKETADYTAPGTKALVTYEQTDAAGRTRQFTRAVDLSGYKEREDVAAIKARLPADAVLVGADKARASQTFAVDAPIELVKNPDGSFSEFVRGVTYRWDFATGKLNIGVLYVLAMLSLAVYGVVVGGWASNNKFSFLGGLRATANMISYEIPLGLTVLCVVLMFGTLDLGELVAGQAGYWFGVIPA